MWVVWCVCLVVCFMDVGSWWLVAGGGILVCFCSVLVYLLVVCFCNCCSCV